MTRNSQEHAPVFLSPLQRHASITTIMVLKIFFGLSFHAISLKHFQFFLQVYWLNLCSGVDVGV